MYSNGSLRLTESAIDSLPRSPLTRGASTHIEHDDTPAPDSPQASRLGTARNRINQRIQIPQKNLHTTSSDEMSTISHISTLLPVHLATNLTHLNLSHMNLRVVPNDLANFHNLLNLSLNDNRIADLNPWLFVKNLTNLHELDLSNNRIPNLYDVVLLGHLQELRSLNLLGNPIGNIGNRPALIQELLFRDWGPLDEDTNLDSDDKADPPSPKTEHLDSPLIPGTPHLRLPMHNPQRPLGQSSLSPGKMASPFTPQQKHHTASHSPYAASPAQRSLSSPTLTRKAHALAGDVASLNSSNSVSPEPVQKRPQSALQYRNEDALSKRLGYVPSPKGTPRIKKVLEERPKSAYMKRTSSFLNREKKSRVTSYGEAVPSTLTSSKYSMKNLQSMKKAKVVIDRRELDEQEDEVSIVEKKEDASRANSPMGYQAYDEKEDRMKQFLEKFRPSDMRAFKDSLAHLLDSFKSTSEIIHRLKDIPVPRKPNTPFPYLITLNGRNISVEEYLIAENEEVFDICQMSPKKVRREKPPSDWIQELDLDDTPFEEEPTGYVTSKQDFHKSEQLTDTLNYIRVNHYRPDIAQVSTYSDARFQVREHADMIKILDKSCKGEFVEMEDYKSIESTKKWSKTFANFRADLGSINFNDVLRWEHKQIKKRADKLIGKKKKKSSTHHVITKHRFENLTFEQVETTMRKMELNVSIASSKRNVKPVQPHNPHSVTEFCRQERIQRKKLAKKKGRQHEFSQRYISSLVQKNHPEDDIVHFFSTSTKQFAKESNVNADSESDDETPLDRNAIVSSERGSGAADPNSLNSNGDNANTTSFNSVRRTGIELREAAEASRSKVLEEKKRDLVESKETILIGGEEFTYPEFML